MNQITALSFFDRQNNNFIRLCFMAASLYIVVEGDDPGFDTFVVGHALARYEDALERLAQHLKVRPLLAFFSADENSLAQLQERGTHKSNYAGHLPQPQWFMASDGLNTVHTLLTFLAATPAALGSETASVIFELCEYERVLTKTEQCGLRWHLAASWR